MNFITVSPYFQTKDGDKIVYPFSPPIFQSLVHENFSKELLEEGRKLTLADDDWNSMLAGQHKYGRSFIYKKEYREKVESYLMTYVQRFLDGMYEQYGKDYKGVHRLLAINNDENHNVLKAGRLKLDTLWINFSKKHDFNPPHTHTGVLSFVIYCKVPQNIFSTQADSNTKRAGEILFQYGEPISELMGNEYPVKPFDNLIFIFPAKLKHFVPSYYVDEERVSVSGNFKVI
tara:strand:+ start:3075 stop:3767 length:693 start_codon:yes stop_codon:yes gene_type:complete